MATLTDEQIKEIADQLDCGFVCYWNNKNGELIFIPDSMKFPEMDSEIWSDELDKIERNPELYKEIEPLDSWDSFKIMEDFADRLNDSNALKSKLISSLNKKKAF